MGFGPCSYCWFWPLSVSLELLHPFNGQAKRQGTNRKPAAIRRGIRVIIAVLWAFAFVVVVSRSGGCLAVSLGIVEISTDFEGRRPAGSNTAGSSGVCLGFLLGLSDGDILVANEGA